MRYSKDWVKSAVKAVPGAEVPELWKEWTALSVISSTLERQVHYEQGAFNIRPNLYVVLIGEPAAGKSTSIRILYNDVFSKLCEPIFANTKEKELARDVYDVYLNPDESADITNPRHMLRGEATHAKIAQCMPNFTTGTTIDQKVNYGSSLAIVTSEFGSFMNKNDTKLQNLLTEGWDSGVYEKGTKGQGDNFIKGMTISWIACATPDMFVENLPRLADKQGLLSRVIPVYVPGNEHVQPLREKKVDEETLESLASHLGSIAIENRGTYTVTDEAAEIIERWRGYALPELQKAEPCMKNYMSRRLSHLLKMSMCYAAGRRKELVIHAEDWHSSYELLKKTEKTMPLVLRRFAMSEAGRYAEDVKLFVKNRGHVGINSLMSWAMNSAKSMSDARQTIDLLIESGVLIREDDLIKFGRD